MAVVAPMAKWRPLTRPMSTTPLIHDIVCWHTMVGTLEGSWSWSNRIGGTYWHFGIGGDGETWQCQDLRYRSAANLEGNPYVIPIETEDINAGVFPSPYANPLWTPAQMRAIAALTAWCCVRYNIPPVLIPDTRKGRRGIGFHAQGIQGSSHYKGGLNWSKPFNGKTCPNRRITQVNECIRMVQAIINPKDWFDMATKADLDAVIAARIDDIAKAVWRHSITPAAPEADKPAAPAESYLKWTNANVGKAVELLKAEPTSPPS